MKDKIIPVKYACENCHNDKTLLFEVGARKPNAIPCSGRCPGPMERKTGDMEVVRLERVARCEEANTAQGDRMRHCETCEAPIGIMSLRSFRARMQCQVCGGVVHG